MTSTGILHVIDSLDLGGAERMAVNLANRMSRGRYRTYLCATRRGGALESDLEKSIEILILGKKNTFDFVALAKMVQFVRKNNIEIIHAHSLSVFFSILALMFLPRTIRLVWHDHYGLADIKERNQFLYRQVLQRCHAVISVSSPLANWAKKLTDFEKVYYIPNFAEDRDQSNMAVRLPGVPSKRVICVANMRPEKDLESLVRAMKLVVHSEQEAHLLLVGALVDEKYGQHIQSLIRKLEMSGSVTWLGRRGDVLAILPSCAIGVISSRSEGLPVALLEYGSAGISVVATDVGQCGELIRNNVTGLLVRPGDVDGLASAIIKLLSSSPLRMRLAMRLSRLVREEYSAESVVPRVEAVYEHVQSSSR